MSKNLKIAAIIKDEASKTFSVRISFTDINGKKSSITVPRSLLNNNRRLIDHLEDHGANIPSRINRKTLSQRLCKLAKTARHKFRAKDFGWQADESFLSFTFKAMHKQYSEHMVSPVSPYRKHLNVRGSLSGWKNTVASNAKYSSPMVFSICSAFAAAILKLSDLNSFGFMLVGPTKAGKSCIQLAAGSVIGFSEEKHLPNFRTTEAALEELTASFNDHPVIVNEGELLPGETKELRARTLRSFAYRLAEGQSKGFSKMIHRPRTFYRTIFIGSIENLSVPKQNLLLPNRISGSEVRLFDISAVKKNAADVFDRAPKTLHGAKRMNWVDDKFRAIRNGCLNNCGVAYLPFISYLVKEPKAAGVFLNKEALHFFNAIVSSNDEAAIRHIARYFAIIVAAGLLAVELKILPWSRNRVISSAKRCFSRAVKLLPTDANALRQACQRLVAEFKAGGLVKQDGKHNANADLDVAKGYYTGSGKHRVVTIRGQAFIDLIGSNDLAFRLLQKWDKTALIKSKKQKAKALTSLKDFESQVTWPDGERHRSIQILWDVKKIKKAIR
jgi:putative DNA primase/helicase